MRGFVAEHDYDDECYSDDHDDDDDNDDDDDDDDDHNNELADDATENETDPLSSSARS